MILCGHPSRLKLRQKYIRLLQTRMEQFGTSANLKETLCSAISEWFDTNSVDPFNYPEKYTKAIESQTAIGWHHVFMGHFSTEWSATHGPFQTPSGTVREAYMWEAAIVEVSLKWFLDLWETRNTDIHGHTKTEQTTRLQTQHRITARRMMTQQPLVRPSDQWMFPNDPDAFLATATANRLGTWIASRRKTIKHSAKKWLKKNPPEAMLISTCFSTY